MKYQNSWLAALAAASLLLSGCAAAGAAAPGAAAPTASETHAAGHTGEQHDTGTDAPAAAEGPPEAAQMVCGKETQDNISSSLALSAAPHSVSSWADKLFTCTYHLAEGSFVISVKESADPAAARQYFDALQSEAGDAAPIQGLANLGFPAYETPRGSVVFLKDNMTLSVDATDLPGAVGPNSVTPAAFAYQIATTILACWTEHP
ncbi:hypothetical protein QK292_16145 [Arthrobacter sp. AL08]|uniref:hypothetical protein n=1 Tax=unclassified Arthrobacter TaxID=235627 RepID=UPI001CFFC973|nr:MULTISPECIES: hypothetical protein [unclassified Arthrobacter]MCB5283930.1 hypothetical protein [Arthrobacter sp. ES1]MDI3243089.1 hypothetical protein [Arthrobacter sp. AL05]MDI3279097.1 hypothetical protein [Arthrobacter sp. AL08]WGZ80975.1 hypothetical protein QI450_07355 [Arthrobacter sp. EM1]